MLPAVAERDADVDGVVSGLEDDLEGEALKQRPQFPPGHSFQVAGEKWQTHPRTGAGFGEPRQPEELRLARCMRSHGVPNFPDPTVGPLGEQVIDLRGLGMDMTSPTFQAANRTCGGLK